MPKRGEAENTSKKVAGNAKKAANAAAKKSAEDDKKKATEAVDWAKGAKSTDKKLAEENKRLEAQRKKQEKEELLRKEEAELKSAKPAKDKSAKKSAASPPPRRGIDSALSGLGGDDSKALPALTASGIDDALDALALTSGANASEIDRHPERRVKAAYAAFEERRLPEMRSEHPGLRLGQMKEMIRKEFEKSPENPMNQGERNIRYDASRDEIAAKKVADKAALEARLASLGRQG